MICAQLLQKCVLVLLNKKPPAKAALIVGNGLMKHSRIDLDAQASRHAHSGLRIRPNVT